LVSIIQRLSGKEITNPLAETFSIGNLAVDAIFIGILFPILEELLFRKILCQRLLPIGEKKAVIISAAVFGLIHGNLYQFAYAFLIGLVLGYVYVKTGRLIYPIICHCAINLYAGVFSSYVVSKVRIEEIYEIMMSENAMSDPEALLGQLAPYASDLTVYLIYTYLLLGLSIAGFAVLLVSVIKKKITFEQGILPTPKKGRISNFFLTGGVAAAIGFLAFQFVFSIFI
jgi:membrane protease YdiL (CAAX protease family)